MLVPWNKGSQESPSQPNWVLSIWQTCNFQIWWKVFITFLTMLSFDCFMFIWISLNHDIRPQCLAHLSWKLKWAFLITCRPSSVRPSVCVNFHIFIFFSRTTGPISTKLGTHHPWVKRIKVCLNEGAHLFSRGDNYEIAKIHWPN